MQFCGDKYFLSTGQVLERPMDLHTCDANLILMHSMLVVCPTMRNRMIEEYCKVLRIGGISLFGQFWVLESNGIHPQTQYQHLTRKYSVFF